MKDDWRNKLIYIKAILCVVIVVLGCNSEPNKVDLDGIPLGKFEGLVGIEPNVGLYEELNGNSYYIVHSEDSLIELSLVSTLSSSDNPTKLIDLIKREGIINSGVYDYNNIEQVDEFYTTGFSGLYICPDVGLGKRYFSESGSVTIDEVTEVGVKGELEGTFFYLAATGEDSFTRVYTTISAQFYAIYSDESIFFVE